MCADLLNWRLIATAASRLRLDAVPSVDAFSIAPLRVTPQPASSYGLHGADPGSAPFSPVTPPRVTLYAKLSLQQWRRGREEYQIGGRTEARLPTPLPAGRSRLR